MSRAPLLVLMLLPLAYAANFTSQTLDPAVSLGGIYEFSAYTNDTVNATMPCLVTWEDKYANVVHSHTTNPDYDAITLGTDGWVRQYVRVDSAFLTAENYSFVLACGNYTAQQQVFVDVAGDAAVNREVANLSSYFYAHPFESMWAGVFAFIAFSIGMLVYKKVRER